MKKKLFFLLIFVVVIIIGTYKIIYKSHRDIASESASCSKSAIEIFDFFKSNEKSANALYIDKTIVVKGIVTNIDLSSKIITVDEKLSARFIVEIPSSIKLQDSIRIKGRLIGFDSLIEEIQMDQCTLDK
jgi:hypothetical protein